MRNEKGQFAIGKVRLFVEARKFARSSNLKSFTDWTKYAKSGKLPDDIPRTPQHVYKNKGWTNWGDFLGTGKLQPSVQSKLWLPFEEARKFARGLKLDSSSEWVTYWKTHKRPADIPSGPERPYKKDWKGWGDFLGTGRIANQNRKYRSYEESSKFAIELGIKSGTEWDEYWKTHKRPADVTGFPDRTYKKQGTWKGWGDFLGTGKLSTQELAKRKRSFQQTKKFVNDLKLDSSSEWFAYCKTGKKPDDIPTDLATYKEWKGWGDFLGTGRLSTNEQSKLWLPFEEARKFARSLKLKNNTEWAKYSKSVKLPANIPASVQQAYKNKGWTDWPDFLGHTNKSKRKYRSFEEAMKFVHTLNLSGQTDWRHYIKSGKVPNDIPSNASEIYKKQGTWTSWGDWFGTGVVATQLKRKRLLPAKEARIAIRKITKEVFGGKPFGPNDWYKAYEEGKIPKNLPKFLNDVYNPNSKDNRKRKKK